MAKKTKEEKPKIKEEKSKIKEEKPKTQEEKSIVAFIEWEGITKDIYDEIRRQVPLEGDVPKGLVSHIATFDKKGLRVVDIWESEEDFNNYIKNRIIPATIKLVDTKPKMEIYPLHALFISAKSTTVP